MKILTYLFTSCFGGSKASSELENEKLLLEVEKEAMLFSRHRRMGPHHKYQQFHFSEETYFSKRTGKEITQHEKINEINKDIERIERKIKGMSIN